MQKGKVKFFKEDKGFGFITDESTNEEIFVHATGLNGKIKKDDRVMFNLSQGKKGVNAIDVTVIK